MDQYKLIRLVYENPQLWDHSHGYFRDLHLKTTTWNAIAAQLSTTTQACKEAFKSLREKYVRERSKENSNSECKWEYFDTLKFLEPHITLRKQSEQELVEGEPYITHQEPQLSENTAHDFYRSLIKLVYQSRPLWDREHRDNHDKDLKMRLWHKVARALKADPNHCMLKWKGLREKYIRQKQKYAEGRRKWEFLDDLSFLDAVILYRRKHSLNEDSFRLDHNSSEYDHNEEASFSGSEGLFNMESIKTEDNTVHEQQDRLNFINNIPDSTGSGNAEQTCRKRKLSDVGAENVSNKKEREVESVKSPEKIFGELVTAMLSNKTDSEKHIAMMQIMQILTRTPGNNGYGAV